MSKSKRIIWPDIAKGITILLVVLYHSFIPKLREGFGFYFSYMILDSMLMPVFFFISGWLFELKSDTYKQNKLKAIGKKFLHLMIPYFSFSVLYYIIINVALNISFFAPMISMSNGGYEKSTILGAAIQILTYQDSMAKSLWFIYTLFILYIIHIMFPKFMKHPIVVTAQFFLPFLNFIFTAPDIIVHIFLYSAYFAVGRLAFNYTDAIFKMKKYIYIIISLIYIVSASVYSIASYYGIFSQKGTVLNYLNIPFKAFLGLSGIIFICAGTYYISNITRATKFLTFIGKNSFFIYLFHVPIFTPAVVSLMIKVLPSLPYVIDCLTAVVISIAASIIISEFILKKIPILNTIFTGAPFRRKRLEKDILQEESNSYVE